jgi:hypothetical protein
MRRIQETVEIDAPAEKVWQVLTDFESYPLWNPFIRSINGVPVRGHRLMIRLQPPGGRQMSFKPVVLEAAAPRVLRWLGKLGVSGIFDGEHSFEVEPMDGERSRFVQSESFRGVLVPFVGGMLTKTAEGFRQMNDALKERVERESPS